MRKDYISWDEFFMGIAELASKRGKDPRTRHGACIIDENNHIISVGYNGLPKGMDDKVDLYWEQPHKHEYIVHAEENAIFNATNDLNNTILYLYSDRGYYPCARCARGIIQNGIKEVVMKTAMKENSEHYNWSYTKHMFEVCNVKIRVLNE